ncbi:unnamed protein product [Macrosiphum euphorbiae]|uniref:Uncharacterized protein n=1 Tax=Macrosiphum euphorbiae TaxID=13131 RepID=A0AAV0VXY8_9HEMI|nr:unnamed protein product [Macrosiphum euphorbiae]
MADGRASRTNVLTERSGTRCNGKTESVRHCNTNRTGYSKESELVSTTEQWRTPMDGPLSIATKKRGF